MKKIRLALIAAMFLLSGCQEKKSNTEIRFAISAEYPPFEYIEKGEMQGLDVDLGRLIASELGKEAVFENMPFSAILPAINDGSVDAGISTITITKERAQNFDFSPPYYTEALAMVFPAEAALSKTESLSGKKIACQLGTTMELWLKQYAVGAEITAMDNNNQAIEALKARHVDGVLMDGAQADVFSKKNKGLAYAKIGKADTSYGVAMKKGSPLKGAVTQAIQTLEQKGELKKLEQKWI